MAVAKEYGVTDGDLCLLYICIVTEHTSFQESRPENLLDFGKKARFEEKATAANLYLKNASLVHLVELMESTHYITVDDVSIILRKTLKEYFSLFLPLHYEEVSLLPDCNNVPELVLVA